MEIHQKAAITARISENLKNYFKNNFSKKKSSFELNNEDDEFWKKNIEGCADEKMAAFDLLSSCFPQLYFPIENEIDKSQEYRDAVLKGIITKKNSLILDYNNLKLEYYNGFAGTIPIVTIQSANEFVKIIQSLCYKNNPMVLPLSMGASFINGINNWKKIYELEGKWIQTNPFGNWNNEFISSISPKTALYKDNIIILSTKPYSNISASTLGISKVLWKNYSHSIRKNHELTHYYTLQKYGSAKNNLHDELIADYVGIITTLGYYNQNWILTFMGLEDYPKYRNGARLENYLSSTNRLYSDEFKALLEIVKNAITNISIFDDAIGKLKTDTDLCSRIDVLCETDLLIIASENGANILAERYEHTI